MNVKKEASPSEMTNKTLDSSSLGRLNCAEEILAKMTQSLAPAIKAQENFSKSFEPLIKNMEATAEQFANILGMVPKIHLEVFTITSMADFKELMRKKRGRYYRGENRNYPGLTPTIFRSGKTLFGSENIMVDRNVLQERYKTVYEAIGQCFRFGPNSYRFYALMQHYASLSPFIDFTKDPSIALAFALSDVRWPSLTVKDDVCIYAYDISNSQRVIRRVNDANRLLDQTSIFYEGKGETKITDHHFEKPAISIIDIPSNDRMQMQKGVFLFLNNYAIGKDASVKPLLKTGLTRYILKKEFIDSHIREIARYCHENADDLLYLDHKLTRVLSEKK